MSYGELIGRIGDHMLLARPTIAFKRLTLTPIASRVSAMIAGERHALIGPLMESLDRFSCPATAAPPNCSGSGSTHSTPRSSTRCAEWGKPNDWRPASGDRRCMAATTGRALVSAPVMAPCAHRSISTRRCNGCGTPSWTRIT